MKNVKVLALCIMLTPTYITLQAENIAPQPVDQTQINKAQNNQQNILTTINNVVSMVQAANNLINPINPTDTSTSKTNQQIKPNQQNKPNILETTQDIVNIVQNANNFIDQILPTDDTTTNNDQTVNILSAAESEKWKYVNNYFAASIGDLNSYEKIGEFINQNAKFLSMPTIILYKFLAEKILTKITPVDTTTDVTQSSAATANATTQPKTTSIKTKALKNSLKLGTGGIKYITVPIIGGLLTYKILKFISARIGTKTTKCNTALINFANDWNKHKEQTPEILWSLFEHLNKELINNNGKMSTVDAALSQKIIEAIATNASIYDAIS